ncbi:uncharacterized protein LTR77_006191 [Saxophila tyrrhenica]|uniref:FAS1 domain-containing protein n=1 Tax=Saxophila tyrrhenica TaxID=1690608 RepID=A0AAV9P7T4_9PEZI|nr:hypothetical protein LTR77_006191 [Saxophila tyrrhenica]
MRASSFILAVFAAVATAQDLATVLSGREDLTTLVQLLQEVGVVPTTEFISKQKDVTLFAPSDAAFAEIVQSGGIFSIQQASTDAGLIEQILRYHLYKGVIMSSDIMEIPQYPSSYLDYSAIVLDGEVSGSNVTGGEVAGVSLDTEGNAIVTTGLKVPSTVVVADIPFDNGVIHVIDKLLLFPLSISETLITGNFTALAGAATQTDLVTPLEELSDVTIFCPNNDAFQRIAGGTDGITKEALAEILQYHVVQGTVGYSTVLSNTTLPTLAGKGLEITITDDGAVFVNNARVINADVLIANGVLHVINEVLSPQEEGYSPASQTVSVSPAPVVPFTSGITPETSVYSELTQTTSFVAAGLVTAAPNATMATVSSGSATPSSPLAASSGVVPATGAGMRNELPAVVAALVGALAFAVNM